MTSNDCIFCAVGSHERPADVVYEDDVVIAFNDINPVYPVHILVIPKQHISSAACLTSAEDKLAGQLMRIGAEIAKKKGLAEGGFRLLTNIGPQAGQTVNHLHVHLLGGERLRPM